MEKKNCVELHLVSPSLGKAKLHHFYACFLQRLSETISHTQRVVVHGTKPNLRNFRATINDYRFSFEDIVSKQVDCWIRDYAPVELNGKRCKFAYHPRYYNYNSEEEAWVADMEQFGKSLSTNQAQQSELILDGGNFISNGEHAIITDRVLEDNPLLMISDIEQEIKEKLGVRHLIIIPCEPDDETGHADGVVRFISTNKLLIAKYPEEYIASKYAINRAKYAKSKNYTDEIAKQLSEHFEVVRLCHTIPQVRGREKMPSAYGNYINFLQFNDCIYLPQYNIEPLNEMALKTIEHHLPDMKIIPVECDDLAIYGGVLNCISWVK